MWANRIHTWGGAYAAPIYGTAAKAARPETATYEGPLTRSLREHYSDW
jgi:hypothetical protein